MAFFGLLDDEDQVGGLLNRAGGAIGNFFSPDRVPEGAGYDKDTLGMARSTLLTNLGLNLYAASQSGLSPAQRAQVIGQMADAPTQYQQMLSRSSTENARKQELDLRRQQIAQTGEFQRAQMGNFANQARLTDAQIAHYAAQNRLTEAQAAQILGQAGTNASVLRTIPVEGGAPAPAPAGGGAPRARSMVAPDYQGDDLDALTRTLWGESRGEDPTGQAAVAHVILNRARLSGQSPRDVVRQDGQFEPWGNERTRAQMLSLDPNSDEYKRLRSVAEQVVSGQIPDPTNGGTHFFSPSAQRALGREAPGWATGTPVTIGNHQFYARPGDFSAAQAPAPQAPAPQAPLSPQQQALVRPPIAAPAPAPVAAPQAAPEGGPAPTPAPQAPAAVGAPAGAGQTPSGDPAAPLSPQQAALARPMPTPQQAPAQGALDRTGVPPEVPDVLVPLYRSSAAQPRPTGITAAERAQLEAAQNNPTAFNQHLARIQGDLVLRQRQWDANAAERRRTGTDEHGYLVTDGNGRFVGALPGKGAEGLKPGERQNAEQHQRDTFEKDPAVTSFTALQRNTRRVLDPATDDYQRMILMVKLNDPTAAVQDGDRKALEQYMSSTTNNALQRIWQELTGKREFTDQTRKMIQDAYVNTYLRDADDYSSRVDRIRGIAQRQTLNPDNVAQNNLDRDLHDRLMAPRVTPEQVSSLSLPQLEQMAGRRSFMTAATTPTLDAIQRRIEELRRNASAAH